MCKSDHTFGQIANSEASAFDLFLKFSFDSGFVSYSVNVQKARAVSYDAVRSGLRVFREICRVQKGLLKRFDSEWMFG